MWGRSAKCLRRFLLGGPSSFDSSSRRRAITLHRKPQGIGDLLVAWVPLEPAASKQVGLCHARDQRLMRIAYRCLEQPDELLQREGASYGSLREVADCGAVLGRHREHGICHFRISPDEPACAVAGDVDASLRRLP